MSLSIVSTSVDFCPFRVLHALFSKSLLFVKIHAYETYTPRRLSFSKIFCFASFRAFKIRRVLLYSSHSPVLFAELRRRIPEDESGTGSDLENHAAHLFIADSYCNIEALFFFDRARYIDCLQGVLHLVS